MKVWARSFNIILALALLCGCQMFRQKGPLGALRLHISTNPDALNTSLTISVMRAHPVMLTVRRDPILTEANVIAAKIKDTPGGFAVEIQFDESGAWLLEQYTAANPGGNFAVFGQWGDKLANGRWLAAPLITRRIANGVLTFTPDASRAEAGQLVLGLNRVAAKIRKGQLK